MAQGGVQAGQPRPFCSSPTPQDGASRAHLGVWRRWLRPQEPSHQGVTETRRRPCCWLGAPDGGMGAGSHEKHLARGRDDLRVRVGPKQVKASGRLARARASPVTLPPPPGLTSSPEMGRRGPACPLCWGPGWEALQVSTQAAPARSIPPASLSHRLHQTRVQASLWLLHLGGDWRRLILPNNWICTQQSARDTEGECAAMVRNQRPHGLGWAGQWDRLAASRVGAGPGGAPQMRLIPP